MVIRITNRCSFRLSELGVRNIKSDIRYKPACMFMEWMHHSARQMGCFRRFGVSISRHTSAGFVHKACAMWMLIDTLATQHNVGMYLRICWYSFIHIVEHSSMYHEPCFDKMSICLNAGIIKLYPCDICDVTSANTCENRVGGCGWCAVSSAIKF